MLDKDAESYPAGTIKAYEFKAGDDNYYAVDAEHTSGEQYWGGYNKLIESLPSTTDKTEALKDYNGKYNTDEIIKALDEYTDMYDTTGAPASEACRARTFNGKQGFLPAAGQFYDFSTHKFEIDTLVAKFFLDNFVETDHWTSTQLANTVSWVLRWPSSSLSYSGRSTRHKVRAFFAL